MCRRWMRPHVCSVRMAQRCLLIGTGYRYQWARFEHGQHATEAYSRCDHGVALKRAHDDRLQGHMKRTVVSNLQMSLNLVAKSLCAGVQRPAGGQAVDSARVVRGLFTGNAQAFRRGPGASRVVRLCTGF